MRQVKMLILRFHNFKKSISKPLGRLPHGVFNILWISKTSLRRGFYILGPRYR